MSTELKPCPFCGWKPHHACFDGEMAWIQCAECGAEGPVHEERTREATTQAAKDAWNKRTGEQS